MIDGLFAEEWATFPQRFSGHLGLSLLAILAGLGLSLPLGILAARSKSVSGPVLTLASIVQTIPGLALLALMVPVLGGRIGYLPAFLALWLYSVLPILRNTIVGLQGIPESVNEAALGVGMTPFQRLVQIELPLAAPVIIAGLRTASVWVVGAATLSTPVGAESLGNYIFAGLQTRNWEMVVFGCLASAFLAIGLDQAIRFFEMAARTLKPGAASLGALILCLVLSPAVWSVSLQVKTNQPGREAIPLEARPLSDQTIVIGAKPFTEQYILSGLLKRRLEASGARVQIRDSLGSTVGFDALVSDEIDVFIDYTGTVWATILKQDAPVARQRMLAETTAALLNDYGVLVLSRLGFENAYAFAMAKDRAETRRITSIADLAGTEGMSIGGDTEFFARPEWRRVQSSYGLNTLRSRGMDSTFMYSAVSTGEVDVITAYTTDGRIDAFGLVLLEDPKQALPPYDAIILLSPANRDNAALIAVLSEFDMAITAQTMRQANALVDLTGESPTFAANWLYDTIWADEGGK